jgi:hypothetical protein
MTKTIQNYEAANNVYKNYRDMLFKKGLVLKVEADQLDTLEKNRNTALVTMRL